MLGVYDFSGDAPSYQILLNNWLNKARKSTCTPALMCHPALSQAAATHINKENKDPIFKARLNEYEVLNSAIMADRLKEFNLVKQPN